MTYRIVKYIICAEFWGDEHHCRPPQYKFWGDVSPVLPVIYAHEDHFRIGQFCFFFMALRHWTN